MAAIKSGNEINTQNQEPNTNKTTKKIFLTVRFLLGVAVAIGGGKG